MILNCYIKLGDGGWKNHSLVEVRNLHSQIKIIISKTTTRSNKMSS